MGVFAITTTRTTTTIAKTRTHIYLYSPEKEISQRSPGNEWSSYRIQLTVLPYTQLTNPATTTFAQTATVHSIRLLYTKRHWLELAQDKLRTNARALLFLTMTRRRVYHLNCPFVSSRGGWVGHDANDCNPIRVARTREVIKFNRTYWFRCASCPVAQHLLY